MVDQKRETELREAIELFFFAYRSFTSEPDRILAKRGLNRIHHRVLYFVACDPGLSVNDLLSLLKISKQALHIPLRQLVAMNLIVSVKSRNDGRVKELRLTAEGRRLEAKLSGTQLSLLQTVFGQAKQTDELGWRRIMETLSSPPEMD